MIIVYSNRKPTVKTALEKESHKGVRRWVFLQQCTFHPLTQEPLDGRLSQLLAFSDLCNSEAVKFHQIQEKNYKTHSNWASCIQTHKLPLCCSVSG